MEAIPYREAVGSLLYAAIATRPDISHAVNECAKFASNPGQEHWTAVKRIMRYLCGTVNKRLCYTNSGTQNNCNDIVCVDAYADADWDGDRDDRKSTSGYVVKLNGDTMVFSKATYYCIIVSRSGIYGNIKCSPRNQMDSTMIERVINEKQNSNFY